MSNRFACLNENYCDRQRETNIKRGKSKTEKEKEKNDFCLSDFPALNENSGSDNANSNNADSENDYKSLLLNDNDNDTFASKNYNNANKFNLDNWYIASKDKNTNVVTVINDTQDDYDYDYSYDVINNLCSLYEQRKTSQISYMGEDLYERIYCYKPDTNYWDIEFDDEPDDNNELNDVD